MALKVVTLEELKAQMREDWDGEDDLITLYGEAAEDAVIGATRRTYEELCRLGYTEQTGVKIDISAALPDETLPGGVWFPSRLKVAILMLAAHSHRNREPVAAVAQNAVPYTLDFYIKPYVKLSDREG